MYTLRAALAALVLIVVPSAVAQTTAGSSTVIVVPVTAQTASFTSEITVYNPNGSAVTVDVAFYEANNSTVPGLRTCIDVAVPAGKTVQFTLSLQCALGAGSHFGLLVLSDVAGTNPIYGYVRTQNPQGIGFSTEGFPAENFNNQVSHATGLKKTTSGLIYQTNCFVGSLASPVNYTLKLFNGATGAQIGSTITSSLNSFEQQRYLDIFSAPPNGVGPIAGDQLNVRAEFASTNNALLVGFCTVQDNTSFGADFRIAKSYGTTTAFVQGGNSFGTTAVLGTTDDNALDVRVNGTRVMRYVPNSTSPNVLGGHPNNSVGAFPGQTVAGGGFSGNDCYDPVTQTNARSCGNQASGNFATVGGGVANLAGGIQSTVAGGGNNQALGGVSTVSGGVDNVASGYASSVPGGYLNFASGAYSFAGGSNANANGDGCFVWGDTSTSNGIFCNASNRFVARALGGVFFFAGGTTQATYTGVVLPPGATAWIAGSDRRIKDNIRSVDPNDVLERLVSMPIATWNLKTQDASIRHMGPMAQDFRQAFGLGETELGINTIDADGVAFAAIQGLYQMVRDKDAKIDAQQSAIDAQRRELAELKARVAKFETLGDELATLRSTVVGLARDRAALAARR